MSKLKKLTNIVKSKLFKINNFDLQTSINNAISTSSPVIVPSGV
jgi:hypothetical protein